MTHQVRRRVATLLATIFMMVSIQLINSFSFFTHRFVFKIILKIHFINGESTWDVLIYFYVVKELSFFGDMVSFKHVYSTMNILYKLRQVKGVPKKIHSTLGYA